LIPLDKELFQLLAETAVKLQSESEPLIKSRQLSKSPTVRAYANVVNQGDDAFADILYKYLNGDVEIDEAVRALNNREGALIKAGNFYQRLEGHHPIYQKLLANRLFKADPRKALEVIKIIRDQLPGNIAPGTDPDKLIYTTRPLHGIIGHGGDFRANTMGGVNTEVTPKEIVDQLYPDLVDAVYRAGYLETNPAHRLMVSKAGEALGMTDPDKQSLKVRKSLAAQSKAFQVLPTELEGVTEATARVVPPDPGNVGRLGIQDLPGVYELGKARGAQNIGGYLPVPIPTGSQLKQLAPGIKGQLPFAASSAIEPLKRGEPTKALEEVAKGTAVGMATDPIVKPIMSRLIPAVGSVAAAAPVATTAAAAVASELVAPRAAQGGPERVTVNGTPYWLDKKANKVYTNDGRPTNFGIDIKGGKPQLVQRGQGAGTKRAEADPLRQAAKGNLMPVLNMLNPMTQLLRFSNSAMKTIRKEV
jgi:hypothetical protein